MLDLAGEPVLVRLIERLQRSRYLQGIIIATTTNQQDDVVARTAEQAGVYGYRGSEQDVLQRTLESAEYFDTEYIVQVTSDCPLLDSQTVDTVIERMVSHPYLDYIGNHLVQTYPLGYSVEIFRTKLLKEVEKLTQNDTISREHVSLYIYEHPERYRLSNVEAPLFLRHPEYRLTLDTLEDYLLIKGVYEELHPRNPQFALTDIIRFLQKNPELAQINRHITQNKGR